MTKHDAALHPGEYFIEVQAKPAGLWGVLYRDNDPDVMLTRYEWHANHLEPGQSVKLSDPTCKVIHEKTAAQ